MIVFSADDICNKFDDDKLNQKLQADLRKIERDYKDADELAKKKIDDLKSHEALNDEFEKEYESFKNNYRVILNVMKLHPSFCERLIEELDKSIEHFHQRAMA